MPTRRRVDPVGPWLISPGRPEMLAAKEHATALLKRKPGAHGGRPHSKYEISTWSHKGWDRPPRRPARQAQTRPRNDGSWQQHRSVLQQLGKDHNCCKEDDSCYCPDKKDLFVSHRCLSPKLTFPCAEHDSASSQPCPSQRAHSAHWPPSPSQIAYSALAPQPPQPSPSRFDGNAPCAVA